MLDDLKPRDKVSLCKHMQYTVHETSGVIWNQLDFDSKSKYLNGGVCHILLFPVFEDVYMRGNNCQ